MINLVIVDDEKLICEGLKIMLSLFEDISVVGTGKNGYEAVELCKNNNVDVVLMDIRMETCNGVIGTKLIKEQFNKVKVLMLTTFKDEEYIKKALGYGASGYLLKDSSHEVIYDAIKSVVLGNVVIHPEIASKIVSFRESVENEIEKDLSLSEKESEIIKLIAEGYSNKEISEKMYLSLGTVKNSVTVILSKLNLRDRTQIAIFAFKHKIVN